MTLMYGEEGIYYSSVLNGQRQKYLMNSAEHFLMPDCQQVLNGSQHVMW